MKIKCLAIALIATLLPALAHAQGTPVKNLFGSGAPNANLASVVGTTYVDQSTSPATVYTCTATTQTKLVSQCTWTSGGSGSSSGAAPVGTFVIQNTSCGSATNCLQLVDDDSTDNCGAALNAFMTNVTGYTGPGVPAVFITDSNTAGKAYKFATTNCNLVFTYPVTIHMNATFDCAQTGTNCIQFGPTGLLAGAVQYSQKYQIDGSGTFIGGASLTVGGIECEPFLANCVIVDINWLNFGATNATLGLCTNYAVVYDTGVAEGTVKGNEWLTTDVTPRRCAFANPGGAATGQNTIFFYDNVLGGAGLGSTCSSVGIVDGGSYGGMRGNNIYGFGMGIRLVGTGHHIDSNQIDSAGCTVGGINAAIQYGATGSSATVGPIVVTNNRGQYLAGHTTYQMAKAADSTASVFSVTMSGNQSAVGGAPTDAGTLMPSTTCNTNINANTGCYQFGNVQMIGLTTCGNTNAGWYNVDLAASCANQNLTANLTTQTLIAPSINDGFTVSGQVLLTTAATTSSTLPTISISYTDVFTNAVVVIPLTPTWTSSTANCGGATTNTIGNMCMGTSGILAPKPNTAITYTTSGYASVGATPMQYQVLMRANRQ
jgi:hypothetical protein